MDEFKFIWWTFPIDEWEFAICTSLEETERVLTQMPEAPRTGDVYKTFIPHDGCLVPIFMCKADNNGTVYVFSDYDIATTIKNDFEAV